MHSKQIKPHIVPGPRPPINPAYSGNTSSQPLTAFSIPPLLYMPINTANDFAKALLEEHHVACVPGEDFVAGGEKCCRFSFACDEDQIRAGMERLSEFVGGLR